MFAVDRTFAGELRSVELIPGGSKIMVTESNKLEYIQRMTEYRLTESIHQQLESFLEGFHDVIDAESIKIFDENELELLISVRNV